MFKHLLYIGASLTALTAAGAALADAAPPLVTKVPLSQAMSNRSAESDDDNEHVELYSGLDVASHGWFYGWIEGTDAPFTNTDTSGLRLRLYSEAGQYQYNSETFAGATNKETWYNNDFLIGYAFEREHFSAALYFGAAIIDAQLSSPDPANSVQGTRVGPMVEGEFEQLFNHNMFAGEAFYTTAFNTYEAKLKYGRELAKDIYVGPEVTVIGDERFVQWRIGAQVTAMNIHITSNKDIRVAIGVGYEDDTDGGPGAYGTVEAGVEF
jgi:Cellulose biosynthesis protein BcsS